MLGYELCFSNFVVGLLIRGPESVYPFPAGPAAPAAVAAVNRGARAPGGSLAPRATRVARSLLCEQL